jgi:hypothetical protein
VRDAIQRAQHTDKMKQVLRCLSNRQSASAVLKSLSAQSGSKLAVGSGRRAAAAGGRSSSTAVAITFHTD